MAEPTRYAVADYRASHGLAHDKAHLRAGGIAVRCEIRNQSMHHNQFAPGPSAATNYSREIISMGQPSGRRKHRAPGPQADSFSLPLRRRAARIARPARVRIRSRKPCVRERRRLFGWKVRLPLDTAPLPFDSQGGLCTRCRLSSAELT